MFYVTGDTHGDFKRFAKRERMKLPFVLGEDDYVIVCGDFGILWNKKDKESAYDKIIHLMRGQVFYIEGKKIFTFGGASSHDIQGGILDKSDKNYDLLRKKAIKQGLPYRVINESWWKEELPSEKEMQEGIANLEKAGWKVDYVISHCASNRVQDKIFSFRGRVNEKDILTDYIEELEQKLQYKHHYFGHYHLNRTIDENHTVLYKDIIRLGTKYVEE